LALVPFAHVPCLLSTQRALLISDVVRSPHAHACASASWASPVSSAFPANRHGPTHTFTARTPATSPAHVPQLLFEPHPHPLSLPCLISPTLALSHALPSLLELVGDQRPPCQLSSPPGAAPSLPEHRPEVRNTLSCSVCLNSALSWLIFPCRSSAAPIRRARPN
jgi:hypothetical protein